MNEAVRVAHPIEILYGGGVALACDQTGELREHELHGLFAADTRVLSTYRFALAGHAWQLLARSRVDPSRAQWEFQNPKVRGDEGEIEPGTVHLRLRRQIDGALHDEFQLRSFNERTLRVRLTLLVDADFADIFEVRSRSLPPRLTVRRTAAGAEVALRYEREGFRRGIRVHFEQDGSVPVFVGGLVAFQLDLAPGTEWRCRVDAIPEIDGEAISPREDTPGAPERGPQLVADAILSEPCERGRADLRTLTVREKGSRPYLAAGAPWFYTLFGRDQLMTALLGGLDGEWLARLALSSLAPLQAKIRDDFRDSEPGKLPHELRRGELARRRTIPQSPYYYGTHDAPALFCLALWQAWRWTGARDLVDEHVAIAREAMRWCEALGDRDGDGFLEYGTRSDHGYFNQSWKDAGDAILHADGRLPKLPIATVELQGYLFAARLALADVLASIGEAEDAERLTREAQSLRLRIEQRYWLDEAGFYALALDGEKRAVTSIASNAGHLLWCGVPGRERAARVARRLLQPDLFSGWGLRTLSACHPRYNALSYQRGSVWPHDTAIAAAGMWRYGEREAAATLLRAILDAALAFEGNRLPELFCGFERRDGAPVPYAEANVPQSWAAAAPVLAAQLFLGVVPDAPRGRCYLDPWLPEWLPRLEVRGLTVGSGSIDVAVTRRGGETVIERLERHDIEVLRESPPAPLWAPPE